MTKELFVSSTPHETKVGMVEDDLLAEIYLERENEYTLAGSIYKGRVTRVLPGMQSAFVDIGLERDAFLYVSDFMELEDSEDLDDVPTNRPAPERYQAQPQSPDRQVNTVRRESLPAGTPVQEHGECVPSNPNIARVLLRSSARTVMACVDAAGAAGAAGSDFRNQNLPVLEPRLRGKLRVPIFPKALREPDRRGSARAFRAAGT